MTAQTKTWAQSLTDAQLTEALYEMRARKCAAAVYDADAVIELFDVERDNERTAIRAWFEENYEAVEDAMCDAAREMLRDALEAWTLREDMEEDK